MNFIKNNWGFLLISIVCVVALGMVSFFCSSAGKELKKQKDEATSQEAYLDSVAKKKIKLTSKNVEIAQKNEVEAEKGLDTFMKELTNKFKLNYEVITIPIEALRKLKDEITALQTYLDDKNVAYSPGVSYFTFDSIAKATLPPHQDDLKQIFRQLAIVKKVVQTAVDSEVISIDELARPMGLAVQEEDFYTFTPIEITVTATPDKAQKFINLMDRADNYLFFLRTVEIIAPDKTTEIAQDLDVKSLVSSSGISDGGGMPGGGPMGDAGMRGMRGMAGMGGMEGMEEGGMMPRGGGAGRGGRRRGRNAQQNPDGMMGGPGAMNPEMAMGGMAGGNRNNDWVDIPMKRQELLAFEPKSSVWKLRFDLIEFTQSTDDAEAAQETEQTETEMAE